MKPIDLTEVKMKSISLIRTAFFVSITFIASPVFSYESGYVWDRSTDWSGGSIPGTTAGNPDDDSRGNPVWLAEYTTGGEGLSSDTPWYLQKKTLMVWDDEWWPNGAGSGRWAKEYLGDGVDNNINPPIGRYGMSHDLSPRKSAWEFVPVVSWVNPLTESALIKIGGSFDLLWEGRNGSPNLDIEVVFVKFSSDGAQEVLYSHVFQNPNPNVYNHPFPQVTENISVSDFVVRPGDLISFSARAANAPLSSPDDKWILFRDDIKLTYIQAYVPAVPEPASWAMFFSALLLFSCARIFKSRSKL
jgi:hypothetical protein